MQRAWRQRVKLFEIVLAAAVGSGLAQTRTAAQLEFEVASIKPSKSGASRFSIHTSHGRFTASNTNLLILITMAYHVKNYQLSKAPDWLNSERFDISAEAQPDTRSDEFPAMVRTLLLDRFKLAVHRETKVLPGYALVVAKTGSKLHESKIGESNVEGPLFTGRRGNLASERITVAQLAETLSGYLQGPVLDMTGMQGSFELHLEWTPEDTPPDLADKPSIFMAVQEQLGLKLEARKVPVEMLVIDHLEKVPSEN